MSIINSEQNTHLEAKQMVITISFKWVLIIACFSMAFTIKFGLDDCKFHNIYVWARDCTLI